MKTAEDKPAGTLAIFGVGMIGGSLARALRNANACDRIIGYGRRPASLQRALELGVIDEASADAASAAADADVIILASPLATTEPLLLQIRDALGRDTIITDVGSAKGCIVAAARRVLKAGQLRNLVPGHPIAGKEKSGVDHAHPDLFVDHLVILTPIPETDPGQLRRIRRLWELTGARVVEMDVKTHDAILAATSHLPHMLAYALVDCLAQSHESEEIFKYAAGGFADFTRIASSNPEMWHDICIANRDNLVVMLDRFRGHLDEIRAAILRNDGPLLLEIFTRAKGARDDFINHFPGRKYGPE